MNLKNAVALVTGGSSGIGRGTAAALIEKGARVAITGRDHAKLEEAAKALHFFISALKSMERVKGIEPSLRSTVLVDFFNCRPSRLEGGCRGDEKTNPQIIGLNTKSAACHSAHFVS
jgi:NAD(P)-dependent dehydrogenase (short-subunit alcohol dehydrogenase family)